jgi:acetoin utilization deacetylase AcuC-like enzyme
VGLYYRHPASFDHDTGAHPENAGRLRAIEAEMERLGWPGLELVEAPRAERPQLERVHAPRHVTAVEEVCARGGGMLDMDTVASGGSWEAALRAAGGAAEAAERLLAGEDRFAFCALRPPGHHAERSRSMGFCLFNNVAVAVGHALAECGVERALILDWDVHHGNGTQDIFEASERVVYASIHQSPLYPGTGDAREVGSGDGLGFTINLPVPPGAGAELFVGLVQHVVVPVARAHRPGLIAISAGYDAHRADPLADCALDEDAYGQMAARVRDVAGELDAPVLVCLEGGYDPSALAASVAATIGALGGDLEPSPAALAPVAEQRARVAAHWPQLA